MSFIMPNYSQLVEEQLNIINLTSGKDWVVRGGPGTGKTVMAIVRARQLSKYQRTIVLVYNRPLKLFLEEAVKGTKCEVKTYNEWVADAYNDYLGRKSYPHIDQYEPDYEQIELDLRNVGVKYEHTIIDEAQDCPIELLRIVKRMSKGITCFVDPNQEIFKNKTNSMQMIKTICVESPYMLTRNFRNTKQIRDASAIFCQDQSPALAFSSGKKPRLVKILAHDYDEQLDYISQICMNNRESTIGIIVNNKSLKVMYEQLDESIGHIMPVQMYKTMKTHTFDFSKSGCQIFSYGTMKGLEFDIVIIARIDAVRATDDEKINYNQLYVATSRPRNELIITYFSEYCKSKWIDAFSKIKKNKKLFNWEEY